MKKCISLISICFILLGLNFPVSIIAEEAIVQTNNLNVRAGPGTNYDKIDQVHSGEVYPIVEQENEWVEIDLGTNNGWVTREYITLSNSQSKAAINDSDSTIDSHGNDDAPSDNQSDEKIPDEEKSTDEIVIAIDNTQIRNDSSTDGDIIYFASKNETFTVLSKTDEWYEIENSQTTGFVHQRLIKHTSDKIGTGLKNKTIVLDAGHGGRDVGAIGASGSYEKNFTYQTTMELEKELKLLGANVILTRDVDDFIPLGGRTSLANVVDTDAFISIHYNSTPELPQVTGIGTYYYHEQNKALANAIQTDVIQSTEAKDRGAAFENFHVIRQTYKPSILIELGFLSNQEEENLLKRNPYQKKIVMGIIHGLQSYFNQ